MTPTVALSGPIASAGASRDSFAPSSSTPHASKAFGQQLQDAEASYSPRTSTGGSHTGNRPTGEHLPKKDSSDTEGAGWITGLLTNSSADPAPLILPGLFTPWSNAPQGNVEGNLPNALPASATGIQDLPGSGPATTAQPQLPITIGDEKKDPTPNDGSAATTLPVTLPVPVPLPQDAGNAANAAKPEQPAAAPATTITPEVSDNASNTPEPSPVPTASTQQSTQTAQKDLTFAVKVKPNSAPEQHASEAVKPATHSNATKVSAIRDPRETRDDQTAQDSPQHDQPAAAGAAFDVQKAFSNTQAPAAEANHAPTPTAHAMDAQPSVTQASDAPADTKAPAPLRQISIQVGQNQQQKVDLQVMQHSGELRVGVRSADNDLAQGLRQGLTDLVGRLEQNGFRADAWRPGSTISGVHAAGDTQLKESATQNQDSQGQGQWSQQGRQQQGNQQQQQRPQWVEELEGNFVGSGKGFTGELNGFTR